MKYIFIAYADARMAYSLKRIGRQAERLGVFNEVILYAPDDLPEALRSSPLMKHSYGGGYWAWKPWILLHTLESHDEGDVVCYVDENVVNIRLWGLPVMDTTRLNEEVALINQMNSQYYYVRFYLEDDNSIALAIDMTGKPTAECIDAIIEGMTRLVVILNDAWPNFTPYLPA